MSGKLKTESETNGLNISYTYDKRGNRLTMAVTGTETYTATYIYDLNNRLIKSERTTVGAPEHTKYYYDPNGNQISSMGSTVMSGLADEQYMPIAGLDGDQINVYNGLNQLVEVKNALGSIKYGYYPNGLRATKDINGTITKFILDGGNNVMEVESGTVTAKYIRGVNLLYSTTGAATNWYLYNAHGDVVQLANTSGAVTKTYSYDAFGNEQNLALNDTNPYRFAGEYLDFETGSYYNRARYYSPRLGRFTQADTHWSPGNMLYGDNPQDPLGLNIYTPDVTAIIQSGNLYVYCMNNPVMYVDPDGKLVPPGLIHGWVLKDILGYNPTLSKERWVTWDAISTGRVDLEDIYTGAIWELKPKSWPDWEAKAQLSNYVRGTFIAKTLKHLTPYVGSGAGYQFSRSFSMDIYDIQYQYYGDGIIHYSFKVNQRELEKQLKEAGQATGEAFLGVLVVLLMYYGVNLQDLFGFAW